MAKVAIIHCESGDMREVSSYSGASMVSTSGLNMQGNYCLYHGSSHYSFLNIPSLAEGYVQSLFRCTHITSNFVTFYNGEAILFQIALNGSGNIALYDYTGALVTTGIIGILTNTTYRIEAYLKIADSGGRFVCNLNGLTAFNYTGDTKRSTYSTVTGLRFGTSGSKLGYSYYDNIIIDSATGEGNWIGNSNIEVRVATGDSLVNADWTPYTGIDHYPCIANIPPDVAKYVSTNSVDQVDTYAKAALTGSIGTIKSVMIQAFAVQIGESTPQNLQTVVEIGDTNYADGVDKPVPYLTAGVISGIYETNPATLAKWTESGINGAKFGFTSKA